MPISDDDIDRVINNLSDPENPSYHRDGLNSLEQWYNDPLLELTEEQRRRIKNTLAQHGRI